MHREIGESVAFVLVYVREAHALDEWDMRQNREARRNLLQPLDDETRRHTAESMCLAMDLTMTTLVDGVDDAVMNAYGAWPDRIYVIGPDGRVAYRGGVGPFGFRPAEVREFLRTTYGY